MPIAIPHIAMLLLSAYAGVIDARSGKIPNWITFPAIVLGPAYYLLMHSPKAGMHSVVAIVLVGFVPALMFYSKAIGGGDVKLFAALGGLGGLVLGVECLFYSLIAAMFVALLVMAHKGQLIVVLRNVWRILSNPFLPKDRRSALERNEMHKLRLGPSIFIGTALALGIHYAIL